MSAPPPDPGSAIAADRAACLTEHIGAAPGTARQTRPLTLILFPRLLIGLLVLISAEVFSGASVPGGLWSPWTWIVTYWLYFAHFFFFTTLALRTGRTSLGSLYLWGVLFGLYESWITKVIWYGYGGDGKLALGSLGPFGFSELSMVFLFHPVMAFLLPLATACLLCPPLRRFFPDLAWFTGSSNPARLARLYVVLSCGATLGMNSGGPVNLGVNLAFVLALLLGLMRLARAGLAVSDGRSLVCLGRRGFAGLCLYLALLYGVAYLYLRPEGLPSPGVQLLTAAFYPVIAAALFGQCPRESLPPSAVAADARESKRILSVFAAVLGLGLILSPWAGTAVTYLPVVVNLVIWTPLGFLLTAIAWWRGIREPARRVLPFLSRRL